MDQGLQVPSGSTGRRLHIAHRRSPSELTPLMMEQLAIQQQIEVLQQQQQQIAATHQQYVNMGMIPPQQTLSASGYGQIPTQMPTISPQGSAFQFSQQYQQPQLGIPMSIPSSHRRNQSALPSVSMGPPPAPSSGASGSAFGDFSQQQSRENLSPRVGRGGSAAAGHARRHSLALPEAKKAAELAEQKRKTSGFQFPIPGAAGATSSGSSQPPTSLADEEGQSTPSVLKPRHAGQGAGHARSQSTATGNGRGGTPTRGGGSFQFPPSDPGYNGQVLQSDFQRRGSSGHGRSSSRNFEGNWRNQNPGQPSLQEQQAANMGNFQINQTSGSSFQPGHRPRASMNPPVNTIGNFQFPNQTQLIQLPQGQVLVQQPQMYSGQGLSQLQLAQLQALQTAQLSGQSLAGLPGSQHAPAPMSPQQQQQQQRKTLFTPYLPQATLPALLSDGQLVAGTLRVNKKNRSDAYVTTTDLDADIFICGSKDRNRALEGDLVAIELLDVDEVWGQKREKEEKKKRKDVTDARGNTTAVNDATTSGDTGSSSEIGIRRRGSLRQRPTQKKNDDVEVEGQSLLLMEEEEINDEQKPLYAGHVVAVIERVAGQMFSGTLGLLRPSSQATKEKQEAERHARDGGPGRHYSDRQQDKPKIVWFKPTDKRVPLIAIPTEQAPRDFVDKHQDYASRIFVACIKRWPITSLHPFGTLVEQLGEMGDLKVETDALLRDNNFGPDEFSEAVLRSVGFEDWSVEKDGESALQMRRDFRSEKTFTIDPNGTNELDDALHFKKLDVAGTIVEIGMHVADVAHFIKPNSLVDREAKKRGTGVYLMNRTVNMLPPRLSSDLCCLSPHQDRYTVSVVLKIDANLGHVLDTWIGKSLIRSSGKMSYEEVDTVINNPNTQSTESAVEIKELNRVTQKLRQARLGDHMVEPLRLLHQLDDENVPVEHNIFDSTPAHELIEELSHQTNAAVARRVFESLREKTWLRRHAGPNPRRLQTFADRMAGVGHEIDTTDSGTLQNSLFCVEDSDLRKGMETLLVKAMQRAKYCVAGKASPDGYAHYALNLPLYTHFTNPSRRYADIIVHRQLEAVLTNNVAEIQEDLESLSKTAELINTKKDSAQAAQEQSVHIESCRKIDKRRTELGGDLICEGVVLCVYDSAFDVLIPEYGFEKRVHCDQLPLKKAEFDKNKRILELYWEKGVPSSTYIPEDERSKPGSVRSPNPVAPRQAGKRSTDGSLDGSSIPATDSEALSENEDDVSQITANLGGVSLNDSRYAQNGQGPSQKTPESRHLTDREKYLHLFTLREEGGHYIQDVTEMTKVPVILKTDLTKSPPCLTIRSVNPYAL